MSLLPLFRGFWVVEVRDLEKKIFSMTIEKPEPEFLIILNESPQFQNVHKNLHDYVLSIYLWLMKWS